MWPAIFLIFFSFFFFFLSPFFFFPFLFSVFQIPATASPPSSTAAVDSSLHSVADDSKMGRRWLCRSSGGATMAVAAEEEEVCQTTDWGCQAWRTGHARMLVGGSLVMPKRTEL
ncbi:uncharacterized protein LOC105766469 [Gossypium raimondii]|uniref:uncharacterized protein LOC105766469 n=1 Tax=Gossypium raimondii TaxID=29730 RepID=UPI00227ADC92|nr:uncharacterized protein LOC105766469 [Gossypium raimondii]